MGLRRLATAKPEPATQSATLRRPETDGERFERYLAQYRVPIYAYVMRLVHDQYLAEDITQETFVRLFRDIADIRDDTASAWMYRVARNLVTDNKRKKAPVLFTVLRGADSTTSDDGSRQSDVQFADRNSCPVEESYEIELQQRLREVLGRMTPKFRDPLLLCDVERLTYEEAAQVLGCSVKTVAARLHRGREFVATCLKKFMDGADLGHEPTLGDE